MGVPPHSISFLHKKKPLPNTDNYHHAYRKKNKKIITRSQQCNNNTSVHKFGSANLSLNFWRQRDDTSLVSCFYQQLRSSPILHLVVLRERDRQKKQSASQLNLHHSKRAEFKRSTI